LNKQTLELVFDDGAKVPSICIECAVNVKLAVEQSIESPGAIMQLLEQYIDELRDGKIEVCAVGRKTGILTKVAVREIENGVDAVECITSNLEELTSILKPERIEVIRYDEDPAKLILASLQLEEQDISSIKFDEKKGLAKVYIVDEVKRSKAIGRDGTNIQAASQLTGWKIRIHIE